MNITRIRTGLSLTVAAAAALTALSVGGPAAAAAPAGTDTRTSAAPGDPPLPSYPGLPTRASDTAVADVPTTPVPCDDNGTHESPTRSQVLARAQSWLAVGGVQYSQSRCYRNEHGDYRTDCSGFVSMAWGLGGSGSGFWTGNLDDVSSVIARSALQAGDALLRHENNPSVDHVALFVRWEDAAQTRPVVIEQTGSSDTIQRTWSQSTASNYTPVRYDHINESVAPVEVPASGTRGDFNGDGYDDVAGLYDYGNSRTALFVWTAKASGGFNAPAVQWDSGNGTWDHSRIKTVAGDFNKDGYDDVGGFYDYGNSRTALFVWTAKPSGGFNIPAVVWDSGNGTWDQSRIKAVSGDFNGDGYGDVGGFYDYGNSRTALFVWTAKSTGGFNAPAVVWDSGNGTWDQSRIKAVSGDFNGDGRTDVGGLYDYGNSRTALFAWTATATGGFNIPAVQWDSGNGTWDQSRIKAVSGDFNGDGYGDVGGFYDYGNSRTALFAWTAKPTGGFNTPAVQWDSGNGTWDQSRIKAVSGDFNADGRTDVGGLYDYGNSRTALFAWTATATGGFNIPAVQWDSGNGTWDQSRIKPF